MHAERGRGNCKAGLCLDANGQTSSPMAPMDPGVQLCPPGMTTWHDHLAPGPLSLGVPMSLWARSTGVRGTGKRALVCCVQVHSH